MAFKRDSENVHNSQDSKLNPNGRIRKKRRIFTEEDTKLANIFEKLAIDDELGRLNSAIELLKYYSSLCHETESDVSLSDNQVSDASKARKVEARLLRGLCSSRKSARLGFSSALTEVLRLKLEAGRVLSGNLEDGVRRILYDIETVTQPEQGASNQEKRDCLVGKVFAFSSIVQSGVLPTATREDKSLLIVFDAICNVMQLSEAPWLKEDFCLICCQLVVGLDEDTHSKVIQDLLSLLNDRGLAKTREGIAIWIEIQSRFRHIQTPSNIWYKNDPLSRKELDNLAKILHSGSNEAETKDSSGAKQQWPHLVWMMILRNLIQRDALSESEKQATLGRKSLFSRFWLEAVDNKFFASTASVEKKAIGFRLFAEVISTVSSEALAASFSPDIMKCLINQSAQAQRYLHEVAVEVLDAITRRARSDMAAATIIFTSLTSGQGDVDFDRLTKSQTVSAVLTAANGPALQHMLQTYRKLIFDSSEKKGEASEHFRQKIADQIVAMIRQQDSSKLIVAELYHEKTAASQIVSMLVELGFVGPGAMEAQYGPLGILSTASRDMFRSRLLSCLTHFMPRRSENCIELLTFIISKLQEHNFSDIITLTSLPKNAEGSVRRSSEILKRISVMPSSIPDQIGSDAQKNTFGDWRHQAGYVILFGMALLQVYSGETEGLAMLSELESCMEDFLGDDTKKRQKASSTVVEIILGFCSQQSAFYRRLAEQAFTCLTPDVNQDGLLSMLEILQQNEGTGGQTILFGQNADEPADGEEISSESGSSGPESDSDVEIVDEGNASASTGSYESSEEDDDDESSDSSENDTSSEPDAELVEFESKLASALKVNRAAAHSDSDSNSDSASTSDESLMDDDQMLELDSTISNMFRQRTAATGGTSMSGSTTKGNTRQAHRLAKETVVAFKNRVLALLTIYLKQQHSNPLSLLTILPLLELIRNTRNAQVAARAGSVLLETYFPAAKRRGLPSGVGAGLEEIMMILADVHRETTQWTSREHVKCGSRACLFLVRVALMAAEEDGKTSDNERRKARAQVAKRVQKLYDDAKTAESRPDWQEVLWSDWKEFRRQVVDVKKGN